MHICNKYNTLVCLYVNEVIKFFYSKDSFKVAVE